MPEYPDPKTKYARLVAISSDRMERRECLHCKKEFIVQGGKITHVHSPSVK
jgi:hypothetical protein